LTIFQGILNFYLNEGDAFLRRRVTEDETWIYNYAPGSKSWSMERKNPTSSVK
jgi:hypothetical protein